MGINLRAVAEFAVPTGFFGGAVYEMQHAADERVSRGADGTTLLRADGNTMFVAGLGLGVAMLGKRPIEVRAGLGTAFGAGVAAIAEARTGEHQATYQLRDGTRSSD